MKKVIIMAAAALFAATGAKAQGFDFGVKAGANMANLSNLKAATNAGDVNVKSRFGLVAGVFAEYELCDNWALSADLLYSQQGSTFKVKSGKEKTEFKLDYINVPILANYTIIDGLRVKIGLQPGFLMSAKAKTTNSAASNGTVDLKKEKHVKGFDLAIPVGLSYELPLGLVFDARYAIGMTKVNDKKFDTAYSTKKSVKNGVASLTVGYKF